MTAQVAQWLIVVLFFACFFAFTAGEILWLSRKKNVAAGRAFAFSFASNLFCITVGFFFSIVLLFGILALAWNGFENAGVGEATIWTVLIIAAFFPFLLLTIVKLLLLKLFRFEAIQSHIKYSAFASFLFLVTITLIPISAGYLIFR